MAIQNFMAEFRASTQLAPLAVRGERIYANGSAIELEPGQFSVTVCGIRSFFRGAGREALNFIVELADQHNVKLVLKPLPYAGVPRPLTKTQLEKWYWRHGFATLGACMERKPSIKINTQLTVDSAVEWLQSGEHTMVNLQYASQWFSLGTYLTNRGAGYWIELIGVPGAIDRTGTAQNVRGIIRVMSRIAKGAVAL